MLYVLTFGVFPASVLMLTYSMSRLSEETIELGVGILKIVVFLCVVAAIIDGG